MTTVGVAIPSIPPRSALLVRALASVCSQTRVPDAISVAVDHAHDGAAVTRNRAWRSLDTDWVAFLDDDDELLPHHLATLLALAEDEQADVASSWFRVVGGRDPFPHHRGLPFDLAEPRQLTVTLLWRRSILDAIGGFPEPSDGTDGEGNRAGEDYQVCVAAARAGARFTATGTETWIWNHWHGNTSGMGSRW